MNINIQKVKQANKKFRAISHPLRIKIVEFIAKRGTTSVTPIYGTLKLEQSVVSQHLKILRDAGILSNKREGQKIIYRVNDAEIKKIGGLAAKLESGN